MKLIQQSVELWAQPEGEIGIYKQIEKAARLCYKSGDKTTEDSYKRFIEMLEERKHKSPYEHGTVYLKVNSMLAASPYMNNPYSRVKYDGAFYITTNYRMIKENGLEEDLKYLCKPTINHVKRIAVHIVTNRAISHELVRHKILCVA